jgi:hypothetical protein
MKYNVVGLDPSLISTAMTIEGENGLKFYNYCRESDATNSKGLAKWFAYFDGIIDYRFIKFRHFNNYSEGEMIKINDYRAIVNMIIQDIKDNIDPNLPTKIGIEGLSLGSKTGDRSDLCAFSTILRIELFDKISSDILILPPSTLKVESCKMTYPAPIPALGKNGKPKKEKLIYRNNDGVAAGGLTKNGIFLCIVENDNFVDKYSMMCKTLKTEIMSLSKIPKPIEDISDSVEIYYYLKSVLNSPTGI